MRYQALTRRGMSGGPVFDSSGRLVGIHGQGDVIGSVRNETSSIPEPLKTGFNAAIPIDSFLDSLAVAGVSDTNLIVKESPIARIAMSALRQPKNMSRESSYFKVAMLPELMII